MTPIEKNVIVVDEQGNILEATYPKRAKGLVKKGRARFISESMICLACPPQKMEENEMSNQQFESDNIDAVIEEYAKAQLNLAALKEKIISATKDELFLPVVELAIAEGKISPSLIQRRFGVGYGRAAYMIDAMEALGLIENMGPSKPRKILPKASEYVAYKTK